MTALRAVLFDLDDTLTDRERSIVRLAGRLVEHFRADLARADLQEIYGCIRGGDRNGYAPREELVAHLQSSLPWRKVPSVEQLVSFWRDEFPRQNVERQGVTRTLQSLHQRGLKLGVISNGSTLSQSTKLDAMGLRSFFSVILISEEVGIKKPDPRIFQLGLDRLGVAALEAIFVGDNPMLDVAGPRAVGIRAIWLNCRNEQPPAEVPRPEIISSIDQVIGLCAV